MQKYIKIADSIGQLTIIPSELKKYIDKEFHVLPHIREPLYTLVKLKIDIQSNRYVFIDESAQKHHILNTASSYKQADIDFLIRAHLASLCLVDDILFLHGSALVKNNKAYIFIGPSGTGKTTITHKVPKINLFSDDTAVIKKIGKRFFIYSSPFDKPSVPIFTNKIFPVKKIFILTQSPFTKIAQEPFNTKLKNIVDNCIFTSFNNATKNRGISQTESKKFNYLIFTLLNSVKIERLFFSKNLNIYNYL